MDSHSFLIFVNLATICFLTLNTTFKNWCKNKLFNDGSHIVYVNNSIQDDTPLGKLMHDFACAEPDKMFYEVFAKKNFALQKS